MDLGSTVKEQEDTSPGLQAEQHELPPLPTNRKRRNLCGCFIHCCLIAVFLGLVSCSLLSISLFVIGNNHVYEAQPFRNSTSGCVLHASKSDSSTSIQLGDVWWCDFVVWTMSAVAIISAVMLLVFLGCTVCSLFIGVSPYVKYA